METKNLSSLGETLAFAGNFALQLVPGDLVLLSGELGSGKTTFCQGVGAAFGIDNMTSPTFSLMNDYEVNQQGIKRLYHLDLYRLRNENELRSISFAELLEDKQGVILIEWPDRLTQIPNRPYWHLNLETLPNNHRQITIERR